MRIRTIETRERFVLKDLLAWNDEIWYEDDADIVNFDFKRVRFLSPFAMLFIARQLLAIRTARPKVRFRIINFEHLDYPAHMGFFECFGAHVGKKLGEARGDFNYLPITELSTSDFLTTHGRYRIQDSIESESGKLAGVLTRLGSGPSFDAVQFSLREILRNVFEHSAARKVLYCAQHWLSRRKTQIVIADDGMGIRKSLSENPRFKDISDRDSVQLALLPGVSGNYRALTEMHSGNNWQNSGYGLYMTSRLCRNHGGFLMMSSNRALLLQPNDKINIPIQNFLGTLIRLDLDLTSTEMLSARLKRYAAEGKEVAKEIAGAQVVNASSASQMLARDFKKPTD
jgi:hypothetical protein